MCERGADRRSGGGDKQTRQTGGDDDNNYPNIVRVHRYAYLDELRPLLQPLTDLTCEFCAQGNIERQNYTFAEPGPDNGGDCPAWNIWKYGLDKLNAYMEVTST